MDDVTGLEVYTDTGCYLESIVKSFKIMVDISLNTDENDKIIQKLHYLIDLELDLAIFGSEKAKSELIKASKNNIVPIKE